MPEPDLEAVLQDRFDKEMRLDRFRGEVMKLVWNDDPDGLRELCSSQLVAHSVFVERAIEAIGPENALNDLLYLLVSKLIEAAPLALGIYETSLIQKREFVSDHGDTREILRRHMLPPTDDLEEREQLEAILQFDLVDQRHDQLRRFVRGHPSSARGHLELGMSYLWHRFRPTLGVVGTIMIGFGDHATRGVLRSHLDDAEAHLQRAADLDATLTSEATSNIAVAMMFRHRYGPAIQYIEQHMSDCDEISAVFMRSHLGVAYREMGEYDAAMSVFHSLEGKGLASLDRHIGLTYLWREILGRAEASFRAQVAQCPDDMDEAFLQGIQAEVRGDMAAACSCYEAVAKRYRFHPLNEISAMNGARRAAKLSGDERWDLEDFCDDLTY